MSLESKVVVHPTKCPICGVKTLKASSVSEHENLEKPVLWYNCPCGVMFQENIPEGLIRDEAYNQRFYNLKEYDDVGVHLGRTYAPIIEELTYGRKMLDVGFGTGKNLEYFKDRGWIGFGIETNKDVEETDRIIKDDFETTDKLYKNTYDLIWMGYVFHKFKNPLSSLKKAYDILQEDGVLFISTSDIEFLYSKPASSWLYWNSKENYVMWSVRALVRELEKLNFNVILKRRNFSSRFGYYYDIQIICQKIFF